MGGSLGLALRSRGVHVKGYARRAETRSDALIRGVVDEVFEHPQEAVEGAEVVVICVPIRGIPELIDACAGVWRAGMIVTDVGSTKAWVTEEAQARLRGKPAVFIGSHPIAGSERMGIEAARADLYEGAVVVVTPSEDTPGEARQIVRTLWTSVGARVHEMSPQEHDRVIGRTSHLPHLVAALLAYVVGRAEPAENWAAWCGPGFRDTTRIAEGSPEVWHDIIATNRDVLCEELNAFAAELEKLSRLIREDRSDSIKSFLEKARDRRRALVRGAAQQDDQ